MQRTMWSAILLVLLLLPLAAYANDELLKLQKDPGQWVMQRKDYAATGYSDLNQITADNVKKLKVAWTFSTGALRGHEGAPLVVGTTMYVHSAFPNHVYALDLTKQPYAVKWNYSPKQDAKAVPVACCDVVHRGLNDVGGKQGGGCTWGWYSYDPELNLLYYSTGNPGTWNPDQRKGDNKWSMTIFARDPDTGMAKWGYQMTPWDAWDYDGVNEHILADLNMDGKTVKALVHFDRNGFGYTLDRTNGTLLVAEPFVFVNWAKGIDKKTGRPIEDPTKRTKQGADVKEICPCAMGGKDQQPSAFSPRTGLFYVPTNNMCMNYEGVEAKYTAGAPYVGANVLMFPGHGGHLGELVAWDATTGKKTWGIKEPQPAWSGVLATAGGAVLYGALDGWCKAVAANNGHALGKF